MVRNSKTGVEEVEGPNGRKSNRGCQKRGTEGTRIMKKELGDPFKFVSEFMHYRQHSYRGGHSGGGKGNH